MGQEDVYKAIKDLTKIHGHRFFIATEIQEYMEKEENLVTSNLSNIRKSLMRLYLSGFIYRRDRKTKFMVKGFTYEYQLSLDSI